TEKVRRKPYSVVLLDEIEKAHPDVFNILLQVLDDGILTDSLGRKVDFRNTIIIMTSNIGARDIRNLGKGIGFSSDDSGFDYDKMKSTIQDALKKVFNPEFLNRIDNVITFRPLEKEDIFQIIDLLCEDLFKRIHELGYSVEITKGAKDFITDRGFDQKYGARPLQRAIQKYVEDPLAEELLEVDHPEGTNIKIKMNKSRDGLEFDWETPETEAGKSASESEEEEADEEAKKTTDAADTDSDSNDDTDSKEESPSEAKA
ncbi:MAG: AAA family ATPase, partial [Balneolaceae bacterium]|nr:AAA family ATPase [Balneolaceae bacterium]